MQAWKKCVVPGKPQYDLSYENLTSHATRKALRAYLKQDSVLAEEIKARIGSCDLPNLPGDASSDARAEEEEEEEDDGDDTDVSLGAVIEAALGKGLVAPVRSHLEVERVEADADNPLALTAATEEEDVWAYNDQGQKWSTIGLPAEGGMDGEA